MANSKKRILLVAATTIAVLLIASIGYVDVKSSSVVPILMYHSFEVEDPGTTPNVTPEIFRKQIEFFVKHKYNIVGLDKVVVYMTKKEKMPSRAVAITVDDGLRSFYKNAYPILKEYGVHAALFMAADRVGEPGYMSWKELREVSDSGLVMVESHTASHPWLPTISVDEKKLHEEIIGSKEIFEYGLRKKVDYICYPNGGFNDLVKETARLAGYEGAFTTNPDKKSAINDIYAIRRLKMSSSSRTPLVIWGKVNRFYAWWKETRW
ncbi:MAG: polysaccharide deacetylase family protein [Candidatus Omnitrophota bacterium]|nr:polysaccharide deacetylase family protein [Candidatus Omnitrophota bacterium]